MKFIKEMISKKSKDLAAATGLSRHDDTTSQDASGEDPVYTRDRRSRITFSPDAADAEAQNLNDWTQELSGTDASMNDSGGQIQNIWDLEDAEELVRQKELGFLDDPLMDPALDHPMPRPTQGERNMRTRLLGFEHADGSVVDLFEAPPAPVAMDHCFQPVGWVIVTDGPGRGACFTLHAGMTSIGRSPDQAIQLDFGDRSISRGTHAAIAYDTETHNFLLGHGGKTNLVRLNGTPVISTEALAHGDEIRIGETCLRFIALCSPAFNWDEVETEADARDDVDAIA